MLLRRLLVWSLPWTLAAAGVFAQSTNDSKDLQEMQKQATRLDSEASQSQGHEAVLESLSKQLNVPVATLQAEQKSTNFGFGQLFIANSLAAASNKTFEQVSQEFKSGKGWGEIAKENNVKLGRVVSDLKRANKQVQKDRTEQMQQRAERGNSSAAGNSGAASNSGGAADRGQQGAARGHTGGSSGPRGKR